MNAAFCSELFLKSVVMFVYIILSTRPATGKKKYKSEDVHPGLGEDLNVGSF